MFGGMPNTTRETHALPCRKTGFAGADERAKILEDFA
jgi:hypothetical protein